MYGLLLFLVDDARRGREAPLEAGPHDALPEAPPG
jgi:hypothetical protein